MTRGSNAQCEQPNRAESDSQHCERYGIVVQPNGTPPCQILGETAANTTPAVRLAFPGVGKPLSFLVGVVLGRTR